MITNCPRAIKGQGWEETLRLLISYRKVLQPFIGGLLSIVRKVEASGGD